MSPAASLQHRMKPKLRVFPTTRWTWVRSLAFPDDPGRTEFLGSFYSAYVPAFELFLKLRFGMAYDTQGREDLIHDFILKKCIISNLVGSADPQRGHLRALLSAALFNFALSDLRKRERGYAAQFRSQSETHLFDHEVAIKNDNAPDCFDVVWATHAVARAAESLRRQWGKRENQITWRVFKVSVIRSLILGEAEPTSEALARAVGTSRATAHRHRERAKRAFRSELRDVVGEYANSPLEVEHEIGRLIKAISHAPKQSLQEACTDLFKDDEAHF